MVRSSRFPLLLIATLALAACQRKTEEPETTADEAGDAADVADTAPTLALLDACKIKMTQPIAHEWDTKWNPAHIQPADDGRMGRWTS